MGYCVLSDKTFQNSSIQGLLDDLSEVDLTSNGVTDQRIIDLLLAGCREITIDDSPCPSFCNFMFRQFSKQIKVTSIRQPQFENFLVYLLDGIEKTNSIGLQVDMLRALSGLVIDSPANTSKFYSRLSEVLSSRANRAEYPLQVCRMAINCVGNICVNADSKLQPYCKRLYNVLLSNLCTPNHQPLDFTNAGTRKIVSSSLRALQYLLYQDKALIMHSEWDILEIIHAFIFTHVSVTSYSMTMETSKDIPPSQRPIQSRPLVIHQQSSITRHLRSLWKPTMYKMADIVSSDSEFSDSDQSGNGFRRQRDYAKIRINAMLCLTAIAKIAPRFLYPSWHKFIPDTFSVFLGNHTDQDNSLVTTMQSDSQPYSLFTILLYDPIPAVRIALCDTLKAMIVNSKHYLGIASARDSKSSFESLSERLASILDDFHIALVYALSKEQIPQVLMLLLGVTRTLIENCSYDRLSAGLLSKIYHAVSAHWTQACSNMRTSILQVFSAILRTMCDDETICIRTDYKSFFNMLVESANYTNSDDDDGAVELRVEAWHTFASLAASNLQITIEKWTTIFNFFEKAAQDVNASVRVASIKFIESIAVAMGESSRNTQPLEEFKQIKYRDWWVSVLEKFIQKAMSDEDATVRSASCEFLASTPNHVFELLSWQQQKLSIALLIASPSDEDSCVRAAACRALGAYILFPILQEDPLFLSDLMGILLGKMNDNVLLVRIRASWAFGNLCDALVLESQKGKFDTHEWISTSVWIDTVKTLTKAMSDHDKFRTNAVRALGSLFRVTSAEYFEEGHTMILLGSAMDGMIKNIETGSLKTRWNACHAACNILRNTDFPIGRKNGNEIYPWTRALFGGLAHSLMRCRNYKVRINACLALATPMSRNTYGDDLIFDDMTRSILKAWNVCDVEEIEYQDYKYKSQLKQQLIATLSHVHKWTRDGMKAELESILTEEGVSNSIVL